MLLYPESRRVLTLACASPETSKSHTSLGKPRWKGGSSLCRREDGSRGLGNEFPEGALTSTDGCSHHTIGPALTQKAGEGHTQDQPRAESYPHEVPIWAHVPLPTWPLPSSQAPCYQDPFKDTACK